MQWIFALLLHVLHLLGGNTSTTMVLRHHTYFILRFPGCSLTGPASMCGCCCFLFAAIVILIRLYAFYFGSPILLHTTHSWHYGTSLTYKVLWLCMWHTMAWWLWSEWLSATPFPPSFLESGTVTSAHILQTLQFPGSAAFHRRVEDFRPPCTRRYTAILSLRLYVCVSVDQTSRGL